MLTDEKYVVALRSRPSDAAAYLQKALTDEQAAGLEALLCPPPAPEEVAAQVDAIKATLAGLLASGAVTAEQIVDAAQALTEVADASKG